MTNPSPTKRTYGDLNRAYDFFNKRLFGGRLPRCLITMQRKNSTYGYFAGDRFGSSDSGETIDEIALNPSHFAQRSTAQVLSTLVHEMVHLWQHHHGKPSRNGYHNKQWAAKMRAVGLVPSSTGEVGGKETGQALSHYIEPGGAFNIAYAILARRGLFRVSYVELWDDEAARKMKSASKTRFTCPTCAANAWGKPTLHVICGECTQRMVAEEIGIDHRHTFELSG
jgi:hypothetical protein